MRDAEAVWFCPDVESGVRHNSDPRRGAPHTCVFVHRVWRWTRPVSAEAEWGVAHSPASWSQRLRVDQLGRNDKDERATLNKVEEAMKRSGRARKPHV